jgi:hypothetical protein
MCQCSDIMYRVCPRALKGLRAEQNVKYTPYDSLYPTNLSCTIIFYASFHAVSGVELKQQYRLKHFWMQQLTIWQSR